MLICDYCFRYREIKKGERLGKPAQSYQPLFTLCYTVPGTRSSLWGRYLQPWVCVLAEHHQSKAFCSRVIAALGFTSSQLWLQRNIIVLGNKFS